MRENKLINLTSVILLTILSFIFIHTELGVASEQEANHHHHDFCELVSNSTTQGSPVAQFLKIANVNTNSLIVTPRLVSFENSSFLLLTIPVERFFNNSSRLSFLSTFLI